MSSRIALRAFILVACLVASSTVTAQEQIQQGADFQRFTPAVDPLGALSVGSGEVLAPGAFAVGLHLNYARNPLVVREDGERVASTLENVLAIQLHGAMHLTSFLQLGFGLPIIAYQNGNDSRVEAITAHAIGDIELQPRFRLLSQQRHGVGLAITPAFTIPSGNETAFAGNGSFTFTPRLSVSHTFSRAFVAGDVWFNLRPEAQVLRYTTVGNELGLRVAGGVGVTEDTELMLELDGALAFATADAGVEGTPLELIGGVRHHLNENVALEAGVGVGVLSAPGVPDFRVVAGVNFGRRMKRDIAQCVRLDDDGVLRTLIASGQDSDGDGIDDACDQCPNEPGDAPTGCPDTDGDGILDRDDECPNEPGPVENNGCPWGDADGDGILDNEDECPNEPGPVENNGCPWGDADGDGILDNEDECPNEPGIAPTGCPDRDGDGILDRDDQCPDEPGIAPHGCPEADTTLVVVKRESIEILEKVHFDHDQDTIQERSFELLKEVARTIKRNPDITKLRVEGHTDDVGGYEYNVDLSQRRAESVKRFLVDEGVAEERLVPQGFSFDRPVVPNTNSENRAANRRVEFNIIFDNVVEAQ